MKRMMYNTIVTVMLIVTIFGGVRIARLININNNNYIREGVVVAIDASNEEVIILDTTAMSGASMAWAMKRATQ